MHETAIFADQKCARVKGRRLFYGPILLSMTGRLFAQESLIHSQQALTVKIPMLLHLEAVGKDPDEKTA